MSLGKQCFALKSRGRGCVLAKATNTDLPSPCASGLRGDIPLDSHLLGVPFYLWRTQEGKDRKNSVCNTIVKPSLSESTNAFPMFPSS